MLTGKGIFIWQVQECENGDVAQIARLAREVGLRHVLVKVADGVHPFPGGAHEGMTSDAIDALRVAGIEVWGWGFVYGHDPVGEADIAIQRVSRFGLDGYVIDAEGAYAVQPAGTATRYMDRLRASLPDLPLALSSFRFPSLQRTFPFDEFLAHCQIVMPQVYWVAQSGGDPAWELARSYQEYADRWPNLIYIPTGAVYGEWQAEGAWWWTARPDQITTFLDKARGFGLPATNFWSWQHARFDLANPDYPGTQLWQPIASYLPQEIDPEPLPEVRSVEAVIALKFRSQPDLNETNWIDQIVFPQGTPFIALGYPTWLDAPGGFRWQRIRTVDGYEGWVCHSFEGTVCLTHHLESRVPIEPEPESKVWVIEPLGLKFRSQPIPNDVYWTDQIVFTRGTRLIAIGSPFADPSGRYRWQKIRASDGREGYVAHAYDSQVYLSHKRPDKPGDPVTAVWTITDLNVRDAPGLHGNVIWTVMNDTRLEVLA